MVTRSQYFKMRSTLATAWLANPHDQFRSPIEGIQFWSAEYMKRPSNSHLAEVQFCVDELQSAINTCEADQPALWDVLATCCEFFNI